MQEYEVKRGMTKDLSERIVAGFAEIFETKPTEKDGRFSISYGSISRLEVWAGDKNKAVLVNTETNAEVLSLPDSEADGIILDTNRRFHQYLEAVTGFTTKERVKRAKKATEKDE